MLAEDVLGEILRFLGDRQLEVAAQLPDGTTTRAHGRCTLAGLSEALLQLHHAAAAALELHSTAAYAYGSLQPCGIRWRTDGDATLRLRFPFDGQRDLVPLHRGGVHATVARASNAVIPQVAAGKRSKTSGRLRGAAQRVVGGPLAPLAILARRGRGALSRARGAISSPGVRGGPCRGRVSSHTAGAAATLGLHRPRIATATARPG